MADTTVCFRFASFLVAPLDTRKNTRFFFAYPYKPAQMVEAFGRLIADPRFSVNRACSLLVWLTVIGSPRLRNESSGARSTNWT